MEASRGRGSRPVEARTSDEEIRVALRQIPLVIPPADVELVGVHAQVQAALHDVLQRMPRPSRHDVRGALPRAQPQAGAGGKRRLCFARFGHLRRRDETDAAFLGASRSGGDQVQRMLSYSPMR